MSNALFDIFMKNTPITDKAAFSFDTFNGVDPWEGERYIKVVPAKLSAELESERDQLRDALLAMREYYKEYKISGVVHNQVESVLSLSNAHVQTSPTKADQ